MYIFCNNFQESIKSVYESVEELQCIVLLFGIFIFIRECIASLSVNYFAHPVCFL